MAFVDSTENFNDINISLNFLKRPGMRSFLISIKETIESNQMAIIKQIKGLKLPTAIFMKNQMKVWKPIDKPSINVFLHSNKHSFIGTIKMVMNIKSRRKISLVIL